MKKQNNNNTENNNKKSNNVVNNNNGVIIGRKETETEKSAKKANKEPKAEQKEAKATVKAVHQALATVRLASQTLNNCLRAINGAIAGDKDADSCLTYRCECGSDVATILGLMGVKLEQGVELTFKDCKERLFTEVKIGEAFAIYKNRAVKDKAGLRVYVANKDGEIEPLSVYDILPIGKNDWTPSLWCRAVEQNWLPKREAKKAEASMKKAQAHGRYFVKIEGAYVEIKKEEVEF